MAAARDNDRNPEQTSRRRLSKEDSQLWRRAVADVSRLPDAKQEAASSPTTQSPPEPSAAGPSGTAQRPVSARPPVLPVVELAPGNAPGIDKRTVIRLRRGLIAPETQIDLHRHTQEEAHRLLGDFLSASQSKSRRCVLVITGKGYGSGGAGVLKTMVPRWLNEQQNRARVLAFCHAVPAHGGDGALYVLLRRSRPPQSRWV